MDLIFDIIIPIIEIIVSIFLPSIFENNLWNNDLPKTIEDFNFKYETKINKILHDTTNKSSNLLEDIINHKIDIKNENDYDEYQISLIIHEELLIKIRQRIKIENMQEEIEQLYHSLFIIIKNIKNLSYLLILLNILFIVFGYYLSFPLIIKCGIYSLTFYSIYRIIDLYYQFKKEWNKLLNYKDWILEKYKYVPKITEIN